MKVEVIARTQPSLIYGRYAPFDEANMTAIRLYPTKDEDVVGGKPSVLDNGAYGKIKEVVNGEGFHITYLPFARR
jgi:hypothetical protein